jgi:short-chain fatty acids transporter
MNRLANVALALTRFSERWIPSSFVIALVLTLVAFVAALVATPTTPLDAVRHWGDGFWELLSFGMQMTLVMFSGYLVAVSPPVDRALAALARVARTPRAAVCGMALFSMGLAWVHWGISIVGAALMVPRVARAVPKVDYRLLVAAAYLGMGTTWHAGLSASAPLLVATPGHFLEKEIGIVPLAATIFSPFNLVLALVVVVLFAVVVPLLHPAPGHALTIDAKTLAELDAAALPAHAAHAARPAHGARAARLTPAERLDRTPWVGWIAGALGVIWLAQHFAAKGLGGLTLNALNFTFLTLAVLLHGRASSLLAAAEDGVRLVSGVVLQFPFYAGIYGIIQGSGLTQVLGDAFVSLTTPRTYPLFVYWYSGIVNYFVPSGGSKWAIEAPYVLAAGKTLGVAPAKTVLAYAWGDMMTDIIQPFWALPLLKAARLEFKDIMGYCMLLFVLYAGLVSLAFLCFAGR